MPYLALDGTTVVFPAFSDRALVDATPLMFLSKVFTSNQDLRYRNVAESDIDCIFKEMLARASVTSYEIKAKCKRILERWECSPDWAAVGRILHRPDVTTSGRTLRPYIPRTTEYSEAKIPFLVQRMSERTREKLVCMGKTLRVYLPSRVNSAALTKTTHTHLIGRKETGGPELYEVEIVPAFHPSIAIELGSRSQLNQFLKELPTLEFSCGYDRAANVVAETFDAKARGTMYTLGSGPLPGSCAIHESLRRFFTNKGYVASSDVVFEKENGVKKTYVMARCKEGQPFMQKLGAVSGCHQDLLVPATFAETCEICQPYKKRAQFERQAPFAIEAQSRQELDFRPTGPKVKLPGLTKAFPDIIRQSNTVPQSKRKLDIYHKSTPGLTPLDDGREDARKKLKVAKEVLVSKLQRNLKLPAKFLGSQPFRDGRNDRAEMPDVVKEDVSIKRKLEDSPYDLARLVEPSRSDSKDTNKRPKLGEKEDLVSKACAEKARDFLTELEESLNF